MRDYQQLQKNIGYQFQAQQLLERALRHRSAPGEDNERLEFLGDAVINMIIAEYLFMKFPNAKEGQMSRMRAKLVCGESLANIATQLAIGDYIELGPGELKSGGHKRASILADTTEAIIAAIFLDSSLDTVRQIIYGWFDKVLANVDLEQAYKDSKTLLQEWLQRHHFPLPKYKVLAIEGPPHDQRFLVTCEVEGLDGMTQGRAGSRRRAEQKAATKYFEKIQHDKK